MPNGDSTAIPNSAGPDDAPNEWLGILAAPIERAIDCQYSYNCFVRIAFAKRSQTSARQTCQRWKIIGFSQSVLLSSSTPRHFGNLCQDPCMLRASEFLSFLVAMVAEHACERIDRSFPALIHDPQQWPSLHVGF